MLPNRGAYSAQEGLIAPVRPVSQLWRLVVGLIVVGSVAFALNLGLQAIMVAVAPGFWTEEMAVVEGQGNKPLPMLLILGSFGFVAAGVAVAARFVQKRSLLSVCGPPALMLSQFRAVLRVLVMLGLVILVLPPWDMGSEPLIPNLPLGLWFVLLPISLAAVTVQAATEELLFRGFIQQSLAARFRHPAVWLVVPSVLFAFGHYIPQEAGENAVLIAVWAGVFGLLMADLTARAGTLGPAIAVHLVNNASALIFVSLPDSLSGLSLYTVPYSMSDTEQLRAWLLVDFALMIVGWLAARVAIRA